MEVAHNLFVPLQKHSYKEQCPKQAKHQVIISLVPSHPWALY